MKQLGRTMLLALAALAAAALCLRARNGVETDLLGLADSRHAGALKEIASSASRQGRVLIEGPAGMDLSPHAESILAALDQPPSGAFKNTLALFAAHGSGLLSARVREQLLSGKYAEAEAEALARLFGPVPPLFSVKADPFLFATDYALSLEKELAPDWTLKNGHPSRELDGRTYALLTVDLTAVPMRKISEFLSHAQTMPPPVRVFCGGPAFHAAATAERAKHEINALSTLSVAAVLAIGFALIRSWRFVPRLLCTLSVAGIVASGALFWFFPRPHVLTFVFGTSLIGLSVDYVYHACVAGNARNVQRSLTLAMLTTVAAFVPLMFAAVNVLRQMALFTVAGLMTAWGWVLFAAGQSVFHSRLSPSPATASSTPKNYAHYLRLLLSGGILLAGAWGLPRLRLVNDPAAFYRPGPYLAEGESMLARLCPENVGRFVYVKGDNLQEALEREETAGVKGLSSIIPSLRRQQENQRLVEKFIAAVGKDYTAKTGIAAPKGAAGNDSKRDALLDPEKIEDSHIQGLVKAMWTGRGLISPCPRNFVADSPHVMVFEPKRALENMFGNFTAATCQLLKWSLAAMAMLLMAFFRRRFLAYVIPLAASLMATAGTLGILGVEVTFFTLLCFFVLAGLGVDYVIFHQRGATPIVGRTVFCSFLTSFIGLGALTFTSFAVTASMGLTFAVGLFYAWFFAWAFSGGGARRREISESRPQTWHEQREQSAGACRLAFMWWVYRLLGKNVLKVVCVPVMLFIYPFAKPAKKALAEFRAVLAEYTRKCGLTAVPPPSSFMHLMGFAWALVDKTDVCTLRRSPPVVEVREDEDFRAFANLVAAGKGAFLVSSHLGTVEVLPEIAASASVQGLPRPRMHAFQQLGHDAEFTRMFLKNFGDAGFKLHAVEDVGVETAVEMQAAVERGELVLMAGDRVSAGSAKVLERSFLGRACFWPKGVFAFALLLECPVFFVTCVHVGRNRYEVHFAEWKDATSPDGKLGAKRRRLESLAREYVSFLEHETLSHPGQWYQFYPFFSQ